ncbi:uncharacterized protein PRCAT00001532001 [Priceomyces carsonii]|uniref:uncharacterized protein n=1 Tax=Priceomyces carsonii TaxID=28549 RepID=UPI002ED8C1EE|nr:unnamed protein product [Priceomyces carsonii]
MSSDSQAPILDKEEILSTTSSSSSFVPIDQHQVQSAIQVIGEDKSFNEDILEYINKSTPSTIQNDYHIISVFGSQSTGKSTLLNKLFNTNFDVMDESSRQQTTKGIWMAHSPVVSTTKSSSECQENVFVMDVEGTDGRERGEDQDFERKAALFAMATSEILIINIWEHQIGLYQGANLGLLKTVFEVNLSLFGKSKLTKNDHKILLLFVIRDHIGTTPKDNLTSTLTQDLHRMWENLSKPSELEHLAFEDFFDINFHTLRHKVLQPDLFIKDIKLLGDRLNTEDELFKPYYHHNIPIDGWTIYAQNCWNQIDNNRDLDLPTQQILVAKFKCQEILNSLYEEFEKKYNELLLQSSKLDLETDVDYEQIGLHLKDLRSEVLEDYDSLSSRYNKNVYQEMRTDLLNKLDEKFKEITEIYANHLIGKLKNDFDNELLNTKGKSLKEESVKFTLLANRSFQELTELLSLDGILSFDEYQRTLNEQLTTSIERQQTTELENIINKSLKKLRTALTRVLQKELARPDEKSWDKVLAEFNKFTVEAFKKYEKDGEYDFGLGTQHDINSEKVSLFNFRSWVLFHDIIHATIQKDTVLTLLKDRFDDIFRYDENGLPKFYENAFQLDQAFGESRDFALKVLPILSIARLSDGSEIIPKCDIFDRDGRKKYLGVNDSAESDSEEDEESQECFSQILSEQTKAEIISKFKKEIDARYIETKRSIVQHVTRIPTYIYLVILLLGWNEFMAVIRNPFFFSLLLILGAGVYILYQMNLIGPATAVLQRLIDDGIAIGKDKLREFVFDNHEFHAGNLSKISKSHNEEKEATVVKGS